MPVSTNFNIPYPDGSSGLTPLAAWFAGIAVGVDNALMTGIGGAPRLANSDTERNTIFPSPVQGNSVMRPDKGWIEQYFQAYNATTNPSGATPAGWYPTMGATPGVVLYRAPWGTTAGAGVQNIFATGTTTNYITPGITLASNGTLSFANPGVYNMTNEAAWPANTSGQRNLSWAGTATGLTNNTGNIVGSGVAEGQHSVQNVFSITSPGQTVQPQLVQNSGVALTVRNSLIISYMGPTR